MNGKLKKGIAGIALVGSLGAGADASNFERVPVQAAVYDIASEKVSVKQTGNVVEAQMPWKGEKGLTIKHDLGEPTASERIKDKEKKRVIAEPVTDFEGGFKIDILLSEKPDTNTFCYDIEGHEDYDFFYQPALTAEEIAEGAVRPEEIVGSYAVYHKTLKNYKVGGTNYATGKVMHIPFPYVWEIGKESEKVRAENLTYENGRLCVVAPQAFLDGADYTNGVRIDPTFGYTSAGASASSLANFQSGIKNSNRVGRKFTPIESGSLDSMSVYIGAQNFNETIDLAVFVNTENTVTDSHSQVAFAENTDHLITTTPGWVLFTMANESFSASALILSVLGNGFEVLNEFNSVRIFFDVVGSINSYSENRTGATGYSTNQENPWTETDSSLTSWFSIYATYTASGGGGSPASVLSDTVIFE